MRSTQQTGLTLIELLLAITILAVITVGCYTVGQQFITADEQLRGRLDALQSLQRSVQMISRDLSQVMPRAVKSFQDTRPAMMGSISEIEFTRGGYLVPDFVDKPTSELARVRYSLNGDGHLVRAVWRVIDRPSEEPDGEAIILRDVVSIQWSYIPPLTMGAEPINVQGLDQWPSDSIQDVRQDSNPNARLAQLPWGVSLTVETIEWGELNWQWEMPNYRGALQSSSATNQNNQPEGSGELDNMTDVTSPDESTPPETVEEN